MNITLNIPVQLLERMATALDRIAHCLEAWAPPIPPQSEQKEPFGPEFVSQVNSAEAIRLEEQDRFERLGYGKEYQEWLEREAKDQHGARLRQGPASGPNSQ